MDAGGVRTATPSSGAQRANSPLPGCDETLGTDHQGSSHLGPVEQEAHGGDRLHRLSQAHVVGENPAASPEKPLHALSLERVENFQSRRVQEQRADQSADSKLKPPVIGKRLVYDAPGDGSSTGRHPHLWTVSLFDQFPVLGVEVCGPFGSACQPVGGRNGSAVVFRT